MTVEKEGTDALTPGLLDDRHWRLIGIVVAETDYAELLAAQRARITGRQFGTALRIRHHGLVSKERSRPMAVQAQEQAPEHAELANELLERIGQTVGQRAQASTIFGEAVEREGVTVIPVAKARFGFGGGGGGGTLGEEGQGSGGGGGGGVAVSPVGYIELRDHGSEFIKIRTPIDLVLLVAAGALASISVKRLLG